MLRTKVKNIWAIYTNRGQMKSPAVGEVHLDEAVELLAHALQSDQVMQWQIAQNMWNKYILPGQV